MKMSEIFGDEILFPFHWTDEQIRAGHKAIMMHDELVEALDDFDRYQNTDGEYLNSPFCAKVREILWKCGKIQENERPKKKYEEMMLEIKEGKS